MYVQYETRAGQFASEPVCDRSIGTPTCTSNFAISTLHAVCHAPYKANLSPYALVNVFFISSDSSFFKYGVINSGLYECCEQEPGTESNKMVQYALKIECGCPDAVGTPSRRKLWGNTTLL